MESHSGSTSEYIFDSTKRAKVCETMSTDYKGDSHEVEEIECDLSCGESYNGSEAENEHNNVMEETITVDHNSDVTNKTEVEIPLEAFSDVVMALEDKKNRLNQLKEEWQSRIDGTIARIQLSISEEHSRLQQAVSNHLAPLEHEIETLGEWIIKNGKDHEKLDKARNIFLDMGAEV